MISEVLLSSNQDVILFKVKFKYTAFNLNISGESQWLF